MKLLVVGLILSLTLAVTASVFAIWPVVADAPWENNDVPVVVQPVQREPSRCEVLMDQLAAAQTRIGALNIVRAMRPHHCLP